MKVNRKIIKIDEELCDGCGNCVPSCAEGAIQIVDGKARLVSDKYCDGLGACLGECPQGALTIEERAADEFDEDAVEAYLHSKESYEDHHAETMACGCPSTQIQSFIPTQSCQQANEPKNQASAGSQLSHWPIQIRLIPAKAPFLKNANLLVTADCTVAAYPRFHGDFLNGRVMLMGCPKFDDAEGYIQKFADIFRTADIKGITVLSMDVPCCQGMPYIVEKGLERAGKKIPVEKVIISTQGAKSLKEKVWQPNLVNKF
ncbi:MAG: 4Fe-4S binding protein [Deltaproteobacteria bacterium]|nr:4Fe-4S binding protein [Deltaproteobacteria bacterium]